MTRTASDADRFPMFPLGTVLLPSMVLPLQVFEKRYQQMLDDVLAGETPEFGVVLIERGSEVGGGEQRCDVGCSARVLSARRATDGRRVLECVGERRIAVTRWLPDDPYPLAVVRELPDVTSSDPGLAAAFGELESTLRRVAALGTELGAPGLPEPLELSDDPTSRSHQLGILSPLGPLDRQHLLAAAGVAERLELIRGMLREQEEMLRARLALGS